MEVNKWQLSRDDELFPQKLKDEPSITAEMLYGIGNPEVLSNPSVAIIGARHATPYGIAIAEMAGRIAGECGVTVISGGAMGCDSAASRAALDAGGTAIIVAGTGADRIYPSSSEDVFRRAVAQGGTIVSIEEWGTPPVPYVFPKRNAIIAGLCTVLLVTEAGERSGTMSTADAALEMGRTIYAVPGPIFSPGSQGTNRLILEGALPICSEVDLEQRLSMDFGVLRVVAEGTSMQMGEIVSSLVSMPLRPDELAARMGQSTLTLLRTLADYESRGIVEHLPDGRYSLTSGAYKEYRVGGPLLGGGEPRKDGD